MKKEYAKLFSFILGITFILSGTIFALSNVYKENKQKKIEEERIIIEKILNVYENFRIKTENFSVKRDSINDDIAEYTSYYTGMEENYETMLEELKNYESLVKEVEDSADYLKNNCINKTYSSADANSKCNAYVINYEKTVNSFIGDVNFFNSKIVEYNEWIVTENEELSEKEKHKSLEKFVSNHYKEYIDINDDGTYLGKEID